MSRGAGQGAGLRTKGPPHTGCAPLGAGLNYTGNRGNGYIPGGRRLRESRSSVVDDMLLLIRPDEVFGAGRPLSSRYVAAGYDLEAPPSAGLTRHGAGPVLYRRTFVVRTPSAAFPGMLLPGGSKFSNDGALELLDYNIGHVCGKRG